MTPLDLAPAARVVGTFTLHMMALEPDARVRWAATATGLRVLASLTVGRTVYTAGRTWSDAELEADGSDRVALMHADAAAAELAASVAGVPL